MVSEAIVCFGILVYGASSTRHGTVSVHHYGKIVTIDAHSSLYSPAERAEKITQSYEDRQLTTQQTLFEFEKLAQEYVEAHTERRRMAVDENTFAIYTALRSDVHDIDVGQANAINALFERYADFQWNEQQKGRLRTELYKDLR
jgi:type I restriction enzyme R subunit